MAYKVIKVVEIIKDVSEALDYYYSISSELSLRFEHELEDVFDKLELSPFTYFSIGNGYRRVKLRSFPYMVV